MCMWPRNRYVCRDINGCRSKRDSFKTVHTRPIIPIIQKLILTHSAHTQGRVKKVDINSNSAPMPTVAMTASRNTKIECADRNLF
jgi:hypothetical protein